MDELVAFLRAALDEDERLALRLPDHRLYVCDDGHIEEPIGKWADGDDRLPNHHNTWLPMYDRARVLAEVQAKRGILDLHVAAAAQPIAPGSASARAERTRAREALEAVARLLAQPHAGQPGWREEWAQ